MPELQHIPLRVAVIPPVPALSGNALFESRRLDHGSHSPNTHWLDCFAAVYKKGKEHEVLFGTADVIPVEEADVVVYMAQPMSPHAAIVHKRRYPRKKTIFVMLETSLGARYASNPRNHRGYDAIITYVNSAVDNKRYFFLPPRAYYRDRITYGLPFNQRRTACLVGTNRKVRYQSAIMAMTRGWKFSFGDWIDYVFCPGELITFRAQVGKMCARYKDRGFDIFGEGWDLLPETRHVVKGIPEESVLKYVGNYRYYFAFENHGGECSLISERIWDALWGDSVPVYMGNTRLSQFVPAECYIDGRQFRSPQEMLEYLCNLPEKLWKQYHAAGRQFIHSEAVDKFLPETFAETFVKCVVGIARPDGAAILTRA